MTSDERPPVDPRIFTKLDGEIEAMTGSDFELDQPLGRFSELISFCEELFSQVLGTYARLEIRGFNEGQKELAFATERRLEPEQREWLGPVLRSFGRLCDEWPDVIGPEYGGFGEDFRRFRTRFIPELLQQIANLAKATGNAELKGAAETYHEKWSAALDATRTRR